MSQRRRVAIAFSLIAGYHEEILLGIEDYVRETGSWSLFVEPDTFTMSIPDLRGWPGDGAIAEVATPEEKEVVNGLAIPVVNLSAALADASVPRVMNDHRAIGRVAAEALLKCELENFAYYGLREVWYSQEREQGFRKALGRHARTYSNLETAAHIGKRRTWHDWLEELCQWLKTLPLPCGVLAVHDLRARMVAEACSHLGVNLPHDVALVGVGNNRIACEGTRPTLSSVARNGWELGHRAAMLLDRLMSGGTAPRRAALVAPGGFVARESTDTLVVSDPVLNSAVRFIREHFSEPINVADVLRAVSISRRWLERLFREHFGLLRYEYLCEVRVARAKQLLLSPEGDRMAEVAKACGFSGTRSFRVVFQRLSGVKPREYRDAHRTGRRRPPF